MLAWPDLPERVREAWLAAVAAAIRWTPPAERGAESDEHPDLVGGRVPRFDESDDEV